MNIKLGGLAGVLTVIFTSGFLFFSQKAGASIQFSNEFWICTNATGNFPSSGTGGTLDNPYDGSTFANFDSSMNYLCNQHPNSTIHILAGTYQTKGSGGSGGGWGISMSNIRIVGSGIDKTILKMVDDPSFPQCWVIATCCGGGFTNNEVSDMTLDANYTSGSYNRFGIDLDGTHSAVRRVKVVNCAFFSTGNTEAWGIVLENNSLPNSEGNIIEECEVSHFAGGPGISAIVLDGGSGIIRNNCVFLPTIQNYFAFNGSNMHDVLIEGNYADGGSDSVYGDTGGSTNVIIVHNTFKNTGHGVSLTAQVRNNITIAFNSILLTNPPLYGAIYAFGTWTSNGSLFTNITIIGNNVQSVSGVPANALNFYNAAGIIYTDNKVDSSLGNFLTNCTGVNMYNNYDLVGNYLSNMNIPTLGGTPVTAFGLSIVGSAGASPALTALGLPSNPLVLVTNGSSQTVIFNTNVVVNGVLNYSNMVAQLLAGSGITTSTVNTSTGQVVTVNANSQTNGFGNIISHSATEFVASTNATIWSSATITNSAAANWAALTVTSSNAVISVHGVNVAILQTNGVLNAVNGLSTTISNTLPAATIVSGGTSNLNWTNTASRNVVVYIDNLAGSVKYNGSPIFSTAANLSVTLLLQPNDSVAITRSSGSYSAYWHPL